MKIEQIYASGKYGYIELEIENKNYIVQFYNPLSQVFRGLDPYIVRSSGIETLDGAERKTDDEILQEAAMVAVAEFIQNKLFENIAALQRLKK